MPHTHLWAHHTPKLPLPHTPGFYIQISLRQPAQNLYGLVLCLTCHSTSSKEFRSGEAFSYPVCPKCNDTLSHPHHLLWVQGNALRKWYTTPAFDLLSDVRRSIQRPLASSISNEASSESDQLCLHRGRFLSGFMEGIPPF